MQHKVKAAECIVLLKAWNYLHVEHVKMIYPKRRWKKKYSYNKKTKPKTRMKCFEKEEEETPVCPPLANTNGPSEYLSRRSLILLWIKTKTCEEKFSQFFLQAQLAHLHMPRWSYCLYVHRWAFKEAIFWIRPLLGVALTNPKKGLWFNIFCFLEPEISLNRKHSYSRANTLPIVKTFA